MNKFRIRIGFRFSTWLFRNAGIAAFDGTAQEAAFFEEIAEKVKAKLRVMNLPQVADALVFEAVPK